MVLLGDGRSEEDILWPAVCICFRVIKRCGGVDLRWLISAGLKGTSQPMVHHCRLCHGAAGGGGAMRDLGLCEKVLRVSEKIGKTFDGVGRNSKAAGALQR